MALQNCSSLIRIDTPLGEEFVSLLAAIASPAAVEKLDTYVEGTNQYMSRLLEERKGWG